MMSAEPDEKRYSVVTGKIKINSASAVELISLPGIGPVLAQRIVEYRESGKEFASRDDLIKIRGIGQKNVEKIMPHIKFE
ncbi:MAG: helix-hairpin-helix domain-containing protein [candidate division Zixibacteria bacterium]|nr:helix-hairpin-helix domain-containing protein [candidate division Zixibacteria bacterium]